MRIYEAYQAVMAELRYSPDQPREPDGKFGSAYSGGSGMYVSDLAATDKDEANPVNWAVGSKVVSPKGVEATITGHTKAGAIVEYPKELTQATATQAVIKMGGGWKLKRSIEPELRSLAEIAEELLAEYDEPVTL